MNILLLGSGGREHALAWKLAQSPLCDNLWASPGNPGIARHAELAALDLRDHAAVAAFCRDRAIALVVVGPEAPLVDGLADSLRAAGISVFGPGAAAARLEGSKGFTKDLCARVGIPTAGYARASTAAEAEAALDRFPGPWVLKADGLAAGKGVVIAPTREAARAAIADMVGGQFGDAGADMVVEEFMAGEEASLFAITDGSTIRPFGSAQDHKRVGDGDTGPNTGGMGAYSPARVLTPELEAEAIARIIAPTVRAMAEAGTPYSGVLYAGLMLTDSGPRLIEYNCRFGDPECQVLMMRHSGDLAALLLACAEGRLAAAETPAFTADAALTVVLAAEGYPAAPRTGGAIALNDAEAGGAVVFHAGTALAAGAGEDAGGAQGGGPGLVSTGGRVLNVTATGASVAEAQAAAYAAVDRITFPTGFCRRDIGWREVERERAGATPTGATPTEATPTEAAPIEATSTEARHAAATPAGG